MPLTLHRARLPLGAALLAAAILPTIPLAGQQVLSVFAAASLTEWAFSTVVRRRHPHAVTVVAPATARRRPRTGSA